MASAIRDTFLHMRPRSWPIVFAHFMGGSVIAIAQADHPTPGMFWRMLAGAVIWSVFLNGGTLALNTAYDRDEEGADIGYLENPPPRPPDLAHFATNLMILGLAAAFALPWGFFWIYATSLLLSMLYSIPPVRLKALPGPDLLVNMIGYGAFWLRSIRVCGRSHGAGNRASEAGPFWRHYLAVLRLRVFVWRFLPHDSDISNTPG
jgi:4-hydroxybenzoate polyprenyltransferase